MRFFRHLLAVAAACGFFAVAAPAVAQTSQGGCDGTELAVKDAGGATIQSCAWKNGAIYYPVHVNYGQRWATASATFTQGASYPAAGSSDVVFGGVMTFNLSSLGCNTTTPVFLRRAHFVMNQASVSSLSLGLRLHVFSAAPTATFADGSSWPTFATLSDLAKDEVAVSFSNLSENVSAVVETAQFGQDQAVFCDASGVLRIAMAYATTSALTITTPAGAQLTLDLKF